MRDDHERIRTLFNEAVSLPVAERAAYLDQAGLTSAERVEVESMLASDPGATAEHLPGEPSADPQVGDTIAQYTLIDTLGEGGFGIVYLAQQSQPVKRKVALKVIKPGMDSKEVVKRFEAERQALALMHHPGIAGVLEAGTTQAGRPYFVMEYVRGEPITEFCDRHCLSTTQRLELFAKVCDAVQHAHQKGVIHRDLTPSNILASLDENDEFQVKVIDFGIAKAIGGQSLHAHSHHTGLGSMIGKFEYMSPEQTAMRSIDTDTRSDVYSLGVVLYELLTGGVPFEGAELRARGYAEIQRVIQEDAPPRPSTRLSAVAPEVSLQIAQARGVRIDELEKLLRRELEWIPLKALRKRRRDRYDSPAALAEDLRRYLRGDPLEAGPESRLYRLRKLSRRHRGPLIAASLILLAIVVGLLGITWQTIRLDTKQREFDVARTEAEQATVLADKAKDEAEESKDSLRSFQEIFDWSTYTEDLERVASAESVLAGSLAFTDLVTPGGDSGGGSSPPIESVLALRELTGRVQQPLHVEVGVEAHPTILTTTSGSLVVRPVWSDRGWLEYRGYDPLAGEEVQTFWSDLSTAFDWLEASPDGRLLAGWDEFMGQLCLWDVEGDRELGCFEGIGDFEFSSDGSSLVCVGRTGICWAFSIAHLIEGGLPGGLFEEGDLTNSQVSHSIGTTLVNADASLVLVQAPPLSSGQVRVLRSRSDGPEREFETVSQFTERDLSRLAFLETDGETILLREHEGDLIRANVDSEEGAGGIEQFFPARPDQRSELARRRVFESPPTEVLDGYPSDAVVSPRKRWVVWWEGTPARPRLVVRDVIKQDLKSFEFVAAPVRGDKLESFRPEVFRTEPLCAFDPTETRLLVASAADARRLVCVDLDRMTRREQPVFPRADFTRMSFSRSGELFRVGDRLGHWDSTDSPQLLSDDSPGPIAPSGEFYCVFGEGTGVHTVWPIDPPRVEDLDALLLSLTMRRYRIQDFRPHGNYIVRNFTHHFDGQEGSVLLDPLTGEDLHLLSWLLPGIDPISESGSHLLKRRRGGILEDVNEVAQVVDLLTGTQSDWMSGITAFSASLDGSRVYIGNDEGGRILDGSSLLKVGVYSGKHEAVSLGAGRHSRVEQDTVPDQDGRFAFRASGQGDASVSLGFASSIEVENAALDATGKRLLFIEHPNAFETFLVIVDLAAEPPALVARVDVTPVIGNAPVFGLAFSPDGSRIRLETSRVWAMTLADEVDPDSLPIMNGEVTIWSVPLLEAWSRLVEKEEFTGNRLEPLISIPGPMTGSTLEFNRDWSGVRFPDSLHIVPLVEIDQAQLEADAADLVRRFGGEPAALREAFQNQVRAQALSELEKGFLRNQVLKRMVAD